MIGTLPCGRRRVGLSSATPRSGRAWTSRVVEAAYLEELEKLAAEAPSEDEMVRARALTEADELGSLARVEERADRLSMYATLFDDPGHDQHDPAAVPLGHRRSRSATSRGRSSARTTGWC